MDNVLCYGIGLVDKALLLLLMPSNIFPACIELLLPDTFAMFCDTTLVLEMPVGSVYQIGHILS